MEAKNGVYKNSYKALGKRKEMYYNGSDFKNKK